MVRPGRKYKIEIGDHNPHNCTIHVLAVIDDCRVVFKKLDNRGPVYQMDTMAWFDLLEREGNLSDIGEAVPSKVEVSR